MGRPKKIEYSNPDGVYEKGGRQPPNPPPPPVATSVGASQTMEDPYKKAARLKAERAVRANEGYKLGDEWLSETGHKVIVTGVGSDEVTFGFTRTVKGDPERRERSVPLSQIEFFLKSYKPA